MKHLPSTPDSTLPPARRASLAARALWSAGACLLLTAGAGAQDDYLLKTMRQQPLRDLNHLTPFADDAIRAQGDSIVNGDFDGDGKLDTAYRRAGRGLWHLSTGQRIVDGLRFFSPQNAAVAVGDFDGDELDEIAWRLDGCPFWIVNTTTSDIGGYVIFDQVQGLAISRMTVRVGDLDADGADEIAVRDTGWPGWGVNDVAIPLRTIMDGRTDYAVGTSALEVVDLDGDGGDTLAWRNTGDDAWNLNGLDTAHATLADGLGATFDAALVALHAGDFDGDGADEIAWRANGSPSWNVDRAAGTTTITDGVASFGTTPTKSVVGDFDGDGTDELAWRRLGSSLWNFSDLLEIGSTIFDSFPDYDPALYHHVGDFNGDGQDDIAWLPLGTDEWNVDTEDEEETDGSNWIEGTEGLAISYEFIYTDVDGDGAMNDYVLMVKNPDGSAFLMHKPLQIAYFLRVHGMTITSAFFEEALSPAQQAALIEDCQTPELASSFTTTVTLTTGTGTGSTTFNQSNFNGNLDSITEMEGVVEYTAVEDIQRTGDVMGTCELVDFSASGIYDDDGAGGEVGFTATNLEVNYGPATGSVYAFDASAKAYIGKDGFALGAGATLVGVDGSLGDPEGTHVSAGVGVGIGAGAGASWGENDLYGAEIDVKFFSLGIYVTGDDAKELYEDGKGWCVQAADDTSDWAENAWNDTVAFFASNPLEDAYYAVEDQVADVFAELQATDEGFAGTIGALGDTVDFFTDLGNVSEPAEFFEVFDGATGASTSTFAADVEAEVDDFLDDPVGYFGGLW